MKKLFTSLVLLMVGVVATYATEYGLRVNGKNITSTGTISAGQTKGTISWDGTSTLTFDGVELNTSSTIVEYTGSIANFYIVLKGNNVLSSSSHGFYFSPSSSSSNLRINGERHVNGTTTITTKDGYPAIWMQSGNTLYLRYLYLNANGGKYAITGQGTQTLDVSEVVLNAKTTESGYGAVTDFASASFHSKDAYLTTGSFNSSKKAVCDASGTPLQEVKTDASLFVGQAIVGIGYTSEMQIFPSGLTKGTVKYNYSSNTLTLDGINISTTKRFIDNKKMKGLKIVVKGANTVSTTNWGIFSFVDCSIEGATSSYTANKLTVSKSFGPVTLWLDDYSGNSTMTLKNLTLDVKGTDVGISGQANSGVTYTRDLVIDNCKITTEVTEKTSTSAIRGFNTCTLTGVDVKSPNYSWFRAEKKEFQNGSGYASNPIEIDVPTTWYPIKVLGYRISNLNTNAFGREGMIGTITWSNSTSTLTLKHVTLKASGDERGIEVGASLAKDLTVKFEEENSITTSNDAFYMGKNTTFTGSGTATFTSTSESGLSGVGGACPTFTIETPIHFVGKKYGYYGTGSSNEVMTITKTVSKGYLRFTGETAAVHNLTALTMNNVDFASNAPSSTNLHGCYFDASKRTVKQNGGIVAKGTVAFGFIEASYGVSVAGTPVNSCNKYGVGSPYITAGGPEAVTYDKDSKTLTLDGATIDPGSVDCCIKTTTDLTIDVKGDCELKDPSGWATTYFGKNTTIKGSGNLTVEGDIWAVGNGTTLKLDDVNIQANTIEGSSSKSVTLNVDLKTAGKRIEVNGGWGVKDFASLKLNTSKIIEPDGGKFDATQKCVVDASGAKAYKVIFADKTATGIEGIEVDTDAEVIGIYDAQGRKLDEMQPGINIIRMSNGTTRKVVK